MTASFYRGQDTRNGSRSSETCHLEASSARPMTSGKHPSVCGEAERGAGSMHRGALPSAPGEGHRSSVGPGPLDFVVFIRSNSRFLCEFASLHRMATNYTHTHTQKSFSLEPDIHPSQSCQVRPGSRLLKASMSSDPYPQSHTISSQRGQFVRPHNLHLRTFALSPHLSHGPSAQNFQRMKIFGGNCKFPLGTHGVSCTE